MTNPNDPVDPEDTGESTDPVPSGSYPAPEGSGPTAVDYGYPFPVEGPTEPGDGTATGDAADTTTSGPQPPVEYSPPPQPPSMRPHHHRMPRDPFNTLAHDQESEFGWGEGMFPDPILDYSGGGGHSRFPIADPDIHAQRLHLAAIKRTDVSNPFAPLDYYQAGNTDRFGAGPPLVRKRGRYKPSRYERPKPPRMQREW